MSKHPEGYCPVFGNYPREYKRAVHGPYYPWVNYGARDMPFYEVKLGDLKSYIARRNKTPQAMIAVISRTASNWSRTWYDTRYGSPTRGLFQVFFMMSLISMFSMYGQLRKHREHKYHW